MKKNVCITAALCMAVVCLFSLEWPSESTLSSAFFGQRNENIFNTALILSSKGTVRSAERGTVLATLEVSDDMGAFPSALGNAVITVHDDGLIAVYGNLDSVKEAAKHQTLEKMAVLGETGSSAWQRQGKDGLIFEIIDSERKSIINPLLLLPQTEEIPAPDVKNVTAENDAGSIWTMGQSKSIPHGTYRLYGSISETVRVPGNIYKQTAPFRVSVTVNGAEQYYTTYETLTQSNGKLMLSGTKPISFDMLYPDDGKMLLAPVKLSRGKAFITVTVRDINGSEKMSSYTIQVD